VGTCRNRGKSTFLYPNFRNNSQTGTVKGMITESSVMTGESELDNVSPLPRTTRLLPPS
jgi:hypothetical protein